MTEQEKLMNQIAAAGYDVWGSHELAEGPIGGSLTVWAEHRVTGEKHTIRTETRGAEGELEALQELARRVGLCAPGDRADA